MLQPSANASNISFRFSGDTFSGNEASGGHGGGAFLVLPIDSPLLPDNVDPEIVVPRAWKYLNNSNRFDGVAFSNNAADCERCTGGALYVSGGLLVLRNNCSFVRNAAGFLGGALLVAASSTMAHIERSRFVNNTAPRGGAAIYSLAGGELSLVGSCFQVDGSSSPTFLDIPQGGDAISIFEPTASCAPGHMFINETMPPYTEEIDPWGFVNVTTWALSCVACPADSYSLWGANITNGNLSDIPCLRCPDYADCSLGGAQVFGSPGYWCGSSAEGNIACLVCPQGYCKSRKGWLWNEMCGGFRGGLLCGECSSGYGEAFGTSECVPDEECDPSHGWWLFLMASGLGLLCVTLLVWIPVGHRSLWKSLVYFMQVATLVVTADGNDLITDNDTANGILNGILASFALDPSVLGIHMKLCPWSGLTAVQKMALGYVLPLTLFAELAIAGGLHASCSKAWRWWRRRKRMEPRELLPLLDDDAQLSEAEGTDEREEIHVVVRARAVLLSQENDVVAAEEEEENYIPSSTTQDNTNNNNDQPLLSRYAAGTMALLLLTYESFTSVTMDLLHCVRYDDDGSLILFRAGYRSCFSTWWQIGLLLFLIAGLVPFPALLLALRWIVRNKIFHSSWHATGSAILSVLEGPYARDRRWWESWSLFRRLVLIALATFVLDPLGRALALFLCCLLVLWMHLGAHPFLDRRHDRVETVFLSDLVLIAALHIPQATAHHLGTLLDPDTVSMLSYTQSALLLLPLVYSFLVAFLMCGHSSVRLLRDATPVDEGRSDRDGDEGTTPAPTWFGAAMRWIAFQVFLLEVGGHDSPRFKTKREEMSATHIIGDS